MAVRYRRRIRSGTRQQLMTEREARREMQQVLDRHAKTMKRELEGAVKDWSDKNRPSFTTELKVSDEELRVTVRPYKNRNSSRIFGYVDQGTEPHTITPKKANVLRFQTGYLPKTAPIVGGGGRATGDWVYAKKVHHPGSKPRHITKRALERTKPQLKREIENLFRRLERRMNER